MLMMGAAPILFNALWLILYAGIKQDLDAVEYFSGVESIHKNMVEHNFASARLDFIHDNKLMDIMTLAGFSTALALAAVFGQMA